ncbi:NPC intracellular cholesterol transporter 2-like [Paramacrobiotus metropolitanus]|uniref:NPC intracellular cholesterol transporter 2-like n=1 Tax=Paramacrobiotus metropolitanus TaxID=2943436 RepID=UPI002445EF44|nr:NPC intracellular cholesterol transporter 2-like [Paramacrobiotus metropolitanus]
MKVLLLIAAVCLASVYGKSVHFKDCGSKGGQIQQVIITPCDKEPCTFKRGDTVSVEVDFQASVKSANATFQASAVIFGETIPLALPQPDACELPNTKCPLTPGTKYEPTEQVQVPQDVPPIFIPFPLQVQLIGDNSLVLLCGEINVKIQ